MESNCQSGVIKTNILFVDSVEGLNSSEHEVSSSVQQPGEVVGVKDKKPLLRLKSPTGVIKLDDNDETSSGYSSPESQCCVVHQEHLQKMQTFTRVSNPGIESEKNCLFEAIVENDINEPENIQSTTSNKPSSPNPKRILSRQTSVQICESGETNLTSRNEEITKVKFIEKETQTETSDSDMIHSLQKSNSELRHRLEIRNDNLEGIVEKLEQKLVSAMTEISQLKNQLLLVNKHKLHLTPCSKCGYHSESDIRELEQTSICRPKSTQKLRKVSSAEFLSQKSTASPNVSVVKAILKGQDPDKMKTALLQRNKNLRDEIENLKSKRISSRSCSTPSLISPNPPKSASSSRSSVNDYDKYDLAMDQVITKESEVLLRQKTNQKPVRDHVRWKQTARSSRKHTRDSSAIGHSQSTSRAFRTINVKTWAT
eukprot:gene11319-12505_t